MNKKSIQTQNLKGASYLTISCLIMCLDNSIIHHFGYQGIPSSQIFFMKVFSGLLFISCYIFSRDRKLFHTQSPKLQLLRSLFGACGNFLWIYALSHLPLSYAVCLSTSSVFFNYLGSMVIFRESFDWLRLVTCIIGFSSMAFTLKADQIIFGSVIFFPLASALCFSCASLIIKSVSKVDSVITTLFYLLLTMSAVSFLISFQHWQTLDRTTFLLLSSLGFLYLLAQFFLVKAYKIAEITFISPFKFTKLPLNFLVGSFIFHEPLSSERLLPVALILFSAAVLFLSELFNALMREKEYAQEKTELPLKKGLT